MKNNIVGTKNTNTPSTLSAGIMAAFGEADGAQRKVVTQDEVPLRGLWRFLFSSSLVPNFGVKRSPFQFNYFHLINFRSHSVI